MRRIDTHAASIFLEADRAWKLKRPIRLGYLDFSTIDRRRAALETELRLNRRTAPHLYRAVHPITRDTRGRLSIDGAGEIVDWLLEMRRFPDDALLEEQLRLGRVDDYDLQSLADQLVYFHAVAEQAPSPRAVERIVHVIDGNASSMAAYPDILPPSEAQALVSHHHMEAERHRGLLQARAAAGRVRLCHGDLHLGNIAVIDAVLTPFDCLEFDEDLATVDVLYDLAFLLMDLWNGKHRKAANVVANRYLDRSPADEDGLALLPLFMSMRAAVRSHVKAAEAAQSGLTETVLEARRYLRLAHLLLESTPPELIAVGGLSGCGKTTVARRLAPEIGRPPGARHLRSDVLRKRLAGVPPEDRLDSSAYSSEANQRVYDELFRLAAVALRAGQSVVADAVFGRPIEKAGIAAVPRANGVPFCGIWLDLPGEQRLSRVGGRRRDASDADADVVRKQTHAADLGPADWIVVPAAAGVEALVSSILMHLRPAARR